MFDIGRLLSEHKSEILTGLGIGCFTYASIAAARYAPYAIKALEEKKKEECTEDLPVKDMVKSVVPYALPSALYLMAGGILIIKATDIHIKKETAAMAAYTLLSETTRDYKNKVREVLGEQKEKKVDEAVAKEALVKNPVSNNEIIITGKGDTLCYEKISGRYFRSDIEKLRKIENELNRRMMDTTFISLNELYLHMGLNPVTLGDELGWDIGRGLISMSFSAQLTDDGEPCLVVDFDIGPKQF